MGATPFSLKFTPPPTRTRKITECEHAHSRVRPERSERAAGKVAPAGDAVGEQGGGGAGDEAGRFPPRPGVASSPREAPINAPLLLPRVLRDPVLLERTILTQGHRKTCKLQTQHCS